MDGGRCGAGAVTVVIHLTHQRVRAVEPQFLADKADEGDVQRRSIEIAAEIEQEDFQERRAIVEGRAAPKTRYAIKTLKPAPDPHRIDAVLEPTILVETDIGRGIAEIAAAFLATEHQACDEPRAASH